MHKIVLFLPLLLPLAACNDHALTELLNGGSPSASAMSTERTPYVSGSTATQAEVNRLPEFAPGQSTQAMHSVLGSPDSYDRYHDYYRTENGGMIAVPYDEGGKWTGTVQQSEAPQWVATPYPGAQP